MRSPLLPFCYDADALVRCVLLVVISLCSASWAQANETRILFLDDLLYFGARDPSGERNPYEERMETERHDFTQSTTTVGRGVVQVEGGYTYFYKDEHGEIEETHTTPEMLWRIGISEDIEIRLRWNYAWRTIDGDLDKVGGQDLIWSLKLGVTEQDGLLPESAVEIRSSAPTGASDWSTRQAEFGLNYIYGWELTDVVNLTMSTGFVTDGLGDFSLVPDEPASDRFTVWSQSLALGVELTERITTYTEWFGLYSHSAEEEFNINIFNIGADYYFTDNFLIDVRAAVNMSPDGDDFFGGFGGGYRF